MTCEPRFASGMPRKGWTWDGMDDLGPPPNSPRESCQACGFDGLRYVHYLSHPEHTAIQVGCVCSDNLTQDYVASRKEEAFKSLSKRRANWLTRAWRVSQKGNQFLNVDQRHIVVFERGAKWSYQIDGRFSTVQYDNSDQAKLAAFDSLHGLTPRPDTPKSAYHMLPGLWGNK